MAYFEWADDLVIDNGPIDEDHRNLVDLVNELHTATSQGQGHDIVEDIMTRLIKYTEEHLAREERIMEQAGFPNLAGHRIGHQKFIGSLHALQQKYEQGSITVASQRVTTVDPAARLAVAAYPPLRPRTAGVSESAAKESQDQGVTPSHAFCN